MDREEVIRLADLAKLELKDEEIEKYEKDLKNIIEEIGRIEELELEDRDEVYNVNDMISPLREDKVKVSLPIEEVTKNTVEEQYGYFKILRVMD